MNIVPTTHAQHKLIPKRASKKRKKKKGKKRKKKRKKIEKKKILWFRKENLFDLQI
jgi:hypothetical protein